MKGTTKIWIFFLFTVVAMSFAQAAQPEGVTINSTSSSSRTPLGGTSINAAAGNVSFVSIQGTTTTQTWQGFYGNISGTITLDNANNKTLYDWNVVNPEGEVYVTNQSSLNWADGNIDCWNLSNTFTGSYHTLSEAENDLALDPNDADGINETFDVKDHPSFYVGANHIQQDTCSSTDLYQNDQPGTDFTEVLLYAQDTQSVIFTSIISADSTGFDGTNYDFEMIVTEKGREGDSQPTTYYFYTEIE